MTGEDAFPITKHEATSLNDAFRLYRKSRLLLVEVNLTAQKRFPGVTGWPTNAQLKDHLRQEFRDDGRFMALMPQPAKRSPMPKGSKLTLTFGLDASLDGEAMFTVWVSAKPKYPHVRSKVLDTAETHRLPSKGWVLRHDNEVILEKRAPTADYPTMMSAVEWFMTCFGELEQAGMFALQREYAGDDRTVVDGAPVPADDEPDGTNAP